MAAAEQILIDAGTSVEALMDLAGKGAAQQIWRISRYTPTLVVCGPGNNGGDGYVIAQWLLEKGVDVEVAALGDPKTEAAENAKSLWTGETTSIEKAKPRPQIVDCVFGMGLRRPLSEELVNQLKYLTKDASRKVAIDLPSGIESDSGTILSDIGAFDHTIALGAYKPSHFLESSSSIIGKLLGVDIGIETSSNVRILAKPQLRAPSKFDHKYRRGLVAVLGGSMPGASNLTAAAAQVAGAGYIKLFSAGLDEYRAGSIVREIYGDREALATKLSDPRISIIVVGPGLGRDEYAQAALDLVLASHKPVLLDADALVLLGDGFSERINNRKAITIATPHSGEFEKITSFGAASKIESTSELAQGSKAIVVHKGADTVISDGIGQSKLVASNCSWLSTAGTGDILTGIIAARFCAENDGYLAAQQGQWLHTRAAQLAGPAFSPEMLIEHLPFALSECL